MIYSDDTTDTHIPGHKKTCHQLFISSMRVLPPVNRSSAIFATNSSCTGSPNTLEINSSRTVSYPGMPIAALV